MYGLPSATATQTAQPKLEDSASFSTRRPTYGDSNYNLTTARAFRWIPDPAPTSTATLRSYYFSDMTVAETMGLHKGGAKKHAVIAGPL